ncbi:MAG: C39 family peptidase [Bryobacteraceae bacterium]|nr:C39 family peptidase [Bryobacteraceae bacterium]
MVRRFIITVVCLIFGSLRQAGGSQAVTLDVPFVRQEKNGCGSASIAMVMEYWQREQGLPGVINPAEIQRALYSQAARGIHASAMERYLREHGFRTFSLKGEWADVSEQLPKGRPLIVALRAGRGALHYVVVTGIDPEQGLVLKHDPAARKLLRQHRADFEREWRAAGNWTLLALPASKGESPSP